MKIESLKKDKLNHEYKVTMDAKEIQTKMDARLTEISKTVKMKGFRPGKAPLKIVRAQYADSIKGEILERAVNDGTTQAINENKIRPALQPKVEVKSFEEDKGLEFHMTVEILPEIKLKGFDKIKLDKKVTKPAKKDIDEALKTVASNQKTTEKVEAKRALKKGDIAMINFDGMVDGERRPGMKADDHMLEIGSGSFIDTFEDQLIGKKPGDKLDVNVTFPDPYGSAELAGKDAVFAVEIKEIHKASTPKVDDHLAKSLGFDDLKGLSEALEAQMQGEYDRVARMHLKRDLLDALDKEYSFDLPHGMVHGEEHNILHQIANEQGIKESDIPAKDKKEYADIAARRVKLGLVLAEVGREHKIEIAPQELQQAVIREAQKYPGQEQQVFEMFQKNPQALESVKAPLFEDKVVDFILESAKVNEVKVSIEELMQDPDEDAGAQKKTAKKAAKKSPAKSKGKKSESKSKDSK